MSTMKTLLSFKTTLIVGGAVAATFSFAARAQETKPIKIGILAPYSGVFALFGPKVIEDPIRLYLKERGNKIAGRAVEIVIADDQSKPDVELEKAKGTLLDYNNIVVSDAQAKR